MSYGAPFAISFSGESTLQSSLSLAEDSSFSLDFWVRSDSFAQQSRLFYCGTDSVSGFGLDLTNTLVSGRESYATLILGGISQIATGNSFRVPFQQWVHVALTRNSTEWSLYRNGALVGRCTSPDLGPNTTITFGAGFIGEMTRLRFWSKALDRSELIVSMCSTTILDSTLIAEYGPSYIGIRDSIPDNVGKNAPLKAIGTVRAIVASDFPDYSPPPAVILSSFPAHMQFFARDADDSSRITIAGSMTPEAGDSLLVELYRNDSLLQSTVQPAASSFAFIESIHCELSQYTVRLFVLRNQTTCLVSEGADLLSGDVFLIDGQSNAHPAIEGYTWQNVFARTMGVQTPNFNLDVYDTADTLWGISSGTGWGQLFSGPYFVGAWARWMQEGIADNWHVPTCVINGAGGGSTIEQHIRNDQDPEDLSTIYGRLLYRIQKSALQHHVRGIFWYQGEWDSGATYLSTFRTIYDAWTQDFARSDSVPVVHFIFQTRPNICGYGDGAVLEAQREILDSFPNCHSTSTVAIDGYDGCHYFWYGYEAIGQQILREVGKYLYHSSDTIDVDPPDILDARYLDDSRRVIRVRFRDTAGGLAITPDTIIAGRMRSIADAFYLDGQQAAIDSIIVRSAVLYIYLQQPSDAISVSYLPNQTYYDDDTEVYSGPWIENSKAVGGFAFGGIPIGGPNDGVFDQPGASNVSIQFDEGAGSGMATLLVHLPMRTYARIDLFDVLGRCRATITNGWLDAGTNTITIPDAYLVCSQFAKLDACGETKVTILASP